MSPTPRRPPKPKPVKPWQRAEAGRYRSSDERFTLESDGGGRWFVTDAVERDELGLARTTGPFATLDAAKGAAEAARDRPAATSPLASRIASNASPARPLPGSSHEAPASEPLSATSGHAGDPPAGVSAGAGAVADPGVSRPAPRVPTWIDELMERDPAAATRATRLVLALEREGIAGADALVRRDLLGDRPAVATRLLARDIIAAIAGLREPTALTVAEAVARVLAASKNRSGLPGWDLVERNVEGERSRPIRLTSEDLTAAVEDEQPDRG